MASDAKRDDPSSAVNGRHAGFDRDGADDPGAVDFLTRLVQLCATFTTQSGIECTLGVSPAHAVAEPAVANVLYRAIRELLTNVRRHSGASRVVVSSTIREDGALAIRVKDDGSGFVPPAPRAAALAGSQLGLLTADQQLREIGAFMEIESDSGACVTIVLPRRLVAAR